MPQHQGAIQPDPATRRFLEQAKAAAIPPMHELGPDGARQAMLDGRVNDVDPPPVARVEEHAIPGPAGDIPLRCYYPPADAATPGALLYFHGGGFVIGDLDTHDTVCRGLCVGADVMVVSVDYRLAPEHPYPAAVDDALAAWGWLKDNAQAIGADGRRLAVGGDSAGGTLAAVIAQTARDEGVALRAQILNYPVADLAGRYPSHDEHASTPPISAPVLDWFWAHFVPPEHRANPYAVPARAHDVSGLAPALVQTAEFDPLRDEGAAYAGALAEAGNEARELPLRGQMHTSIGGVDMIISANDARAEVAAALAGFLGVPSPELVAPSG